MLTAIVFIIILSLLVFVHEFGHYIIAKRKGLLVEEFGFGFPPRIFGWKRGETLYSINLIPFGGFVKILGEEGEEKDNPRSFSYQKVSTRIAIVCAGVLMNIFLMVIILIFGNFWGLPKVIDNNIPSVANIRDLKIQILGVASNSPAELVNLKMGDEIVSASVNGDFLKVKEVEELQDFVKKHKGQNVILTIKRQNEILEKTVFARQTHPQNEGSLGIILAKTAIVSYPIYLAPIYGIKDTIYLTGHFFQALFFLFKNLIINGKIVGEVGGPVQIALLVHEMTQLGFAFILQFTALLSLNLAILNILPFPALDGGRLIFLIIEGLSKKPIKSSIEKIIHFIGFLILIILTILITIKDIKKLF